MRVGLIGYPVRHSISPFFQQSAFDAVGLDVRYELWETPAEQFQEVVLRLRGADYLGANVTIPYKQAVIRLLDRVDPLAGTIGAVNTIVRRSDGHLEGFNTDVEGFLRSLREDGAIELEGADVVLLGSGGAARAVVAAAIQSGVRQLVIGCRRPPSAEQLVADLARGGLAGVSQRVKIVDLADPALVQHAIRTSQVLVNATPVGMASHEEPDALPIPADWLHPRLLVCDLIYNPPVTPLLRAAGEIGARTLNGLPMLVYQGAAAFERWTGREAPIALMQQRAREALHV